MEPFVVILLIGFRVLVAAAVAVAIAAWIRRTPGLASQFLVSTALVVFLGVAGVLVLLIDGDAWLTVFLALPAAAGAGAVLLAEGGTTVRVGVAVAVTAIVLASALLILLGLEGLVCCVMASPIVAVCYSVGAGTGLLLRLLAKTISGARRNDTPLRAITVTLLLLALPTARDLELAHVAGPRVEPVESRVRIAAPPQEVWDALEEIDAIHGPKPLLLRLGLPVPRMCEMEGEGVGARRTCRFDVGYIEERVSLWDPPRRMELEIVGWTLPGRHWLGYRSASYELVPTADGTEVVRVTTITSNLRPSLYWRPLERLGVRSEHDYLLRDLKQRLESH